MLRGYLPNESQPSTSPGWVGLGTFRRLQRSIYEEAREVARALAKTEVFKRSRHDRKRIEMLAPRSRNDTPAQDRRAQLALRLRYRGIDRIVELPLSEGVLAWLAIEAHFRNLSISDLTAKLIIAGLGSREPVGLTPGGLHSMPMKDAPERYRLGELASAHPGRGGWGERALVKPLTAGQAVV
jgi:hypothetical protein